MSKQCDHYINYILCHSSEYTKKQFETKIDDKYQDIPPFVTPITIEEGS